VSGVGNSPTRLDEPAGGNTSCTGDKELNFFRVKTRPGARTVYECRKHYCCGSPWVVTLIVLLAGLILAASSFFLVNGYVNPGLEIRLLKGKLMLACGPLHLAIRKKWFCRWVEPRSA